LRNFVSTIVKKGIPNIYGYSCFWRENSRRNPRSNETADHDCTSASLPNLLSRLQLGRVVRCENECRIVGGCFTRAIVRSGFCVSNERNSTKTTTTTTIGNEFDRSSRSEESPTREVYTGALLIICRRLSSSREESSLERFFFSFLPSFLSLRSRRRFLPFFLFSACTTSHLCPSIFSHAKRPVISMRPRWCTCNLRIEF